MALQIVVHLFERTSRWLRVGMRARDDDQALSHEIFGDVGGVFLGRHRDGRGNCHCNCVVDAVVARDDDAAAEAALRSREAERGGEHVRLPPVL